MAAPIQYPTIVVNFPEQHVIRNRGCRLDLPRDHVLLAGQSRWGAGGVRLYGRSNDAVLTIVGNPILHECLWPHLAYPTYRDRLIEHGEILRLTVLPPDLRCQRLDLTGVVDLYGNYERITDLTGSRWVCRRADDFSQVPKINLVAECPCKILFRSPNVDRSAANYYGLHEPCDGGSGSLAIRSPAMNWPQQCGAGGWSD